MAWDTENKPSGTIDYLLKEDGFYLLTEDGDKIILDQSSVFSADSKPTATSFTTAAKPGTSTWNTTNKPS